MFLLAFFDIMVYLKIHLPYEAMLAVPIQNKWMYPFERTLGTYKQDVHNKAHLEGSIIEVYIANKSLIFYFMYLQGIKIRFNHPK